MDGAAQIQKMMSDMRENPLKTIFSEKVEYFSDYQSSIQKNLITGEEKTIDLPKSNVLIYHTVNGTRIAARPSGTEPKIKFYFSVNATLERKEEAATVEATLDEKIRGIIKELELN